MDYFFRSEKVSDIDVIDLLLKKTFPSDEEANIVASLRDHGQLTFSLVAVSNEGDNEKIVGHLALSPVLIESKEVSGKSWQALGLAPVSVLPEHQGKGVGSALINFWFDEYADSFFNAVFLLGDPKFYQRIGFELAKNYEFYSDFPDSENYFQVRFLKQNFPNKAEGDVYYHQVFYKT